MATAHDYLHALIFSTHRHPCPGDYCQGSLRPCSDPYCQPGSKLCRDCHAELDDRSEALRAVVNSQIPLVQTISDKETAMINASQARKLYAQPLFTLEEIEQQIKEKAVDENHTCFDKARMNDELLEALRNQGFTIGSGAHSYVVSWEVVAV